MLAGYPDVAEDVRRLTMRRVFDDATVAQGVRGIETLDSNVLRTMLADENQMARLQSVLTADDIRRIRDVQQVFDPASNASRTFRAAGGLAASGSILQMVRNGEFRYAGQAAKNFLLAEVYTNGHIERYFSNTRFSSQDKANIANLLIGSGPHIRALMNTFREEAAVQAQTELKQSIDRSASEAEGGTVNMDEIDAAIQQLR